MVLYPNKLPESERVCFGICIIFILNQCSMVTKFKNHLARTNLARNTINSYVWTIEYFLNHYVSFQNWRID